MVALMVRLEDYPDSPAHMITEEGTPETIMHFLSGFLTGRVIVDSMKVMGK